MTRCQAEWSNFGTAGVTPEAGTAAANTAPCFSASKLLDLNASRHVRRKLNDSPSFYDETGAPRASHHGSDGSHELHGTASRPTHADSAPDLVSGSSLHPSDCAKAAGSAHPSSKDNSTVANGPTASYGTSVQQQVGRAHTPVGVAQRQYQRHHLKSIYQPSDTPRVATEQPQSKPQNSFTPTKDGQQTPDLGSGMQQLGNGQPSRCDFPMQFGKSGQVGTSLWQTSARAELPGLSSDKSSVNGAVHPNGQSCDEPQMQAAPHNQTGSQLLTGAKAPEVLAGPLQIGLTKAAAPKQVHSQPGTVQKRKGGLFKQMQSCIST